MTTAHPDRRGADAPDAALDGAASTGTARRPGEPPARCGGPPGAVPTTPPRRPSLAASDVPPGATSFDDLFASEYSATVRLAHLLTGSNAAAEDLAQDAFARVLPHHHRLDNPAAYLRTATVNVCRNWHRTRRREHDRFRRHGESPVVDPVVDHAEMSPRSAELLAAVRHLPYRQQAVLVLRYWLDLSEADIAGTLGCRPGTVKSLHARAIDAVRGVLATDPSEETT